jgi:hypothetical protein
VGKQNSAHDKIKIGNNKYIFEATKEEEYLLTYDKGAKKEIKIVFADEDTEDVTNKIIQALSERYIERCLKNGCEKS